MKLPLLFAVLFLALAGLASAAFNITLNSPNEYFVHNATSIVFNWTARNDSDAQATNFTCNLYNTSASNPVSTNYSKSDSLNSSQGNYSNATFSFPDGVRVWWFIGCNDKQSFTNTSFRIFDVDTSQFILSLGFNRIINFSVDSGDANFSGLLRAPNLAGNLTGNSSSGNQFETAITSVGSDLTNFTAGTNASGINITGNAGNLTTSVSGSNLIIQLMTIINGLVNVVTSRLEAVTGHFTSVNSTSILSTNVSVVTNLTAGNFVGAGTLTGNLTGNITLGKNYTLRNDTAANGSLFTCGLFGAGEFRCANVT